MTTELYTQTRRYEVKLYKGHGQRIGRDGVAQTFSRKSLELLEVYPDTEAMDGEGVVIAEDTEGGQWQCDLTSWVESPLDPNEEQPDA